MKGLLENSLAPLTFSIGFLKAPLPSVCDEYLRWKGSDFQRIESVDVDSDLPSALRQLEPLTIPPRRSLFLSTDSEWTAYFDNGSRGADAFPPISYLAEQLACLGVIALCVPHTLTTETGERSGMYGAVRFELFGPAQTDFLNRQRSIGVVYDGGKWRFDAEGAIQIFEEVENYSCRRIVERFPYETLDRYCLAMGIRAFDSAFYKRHGKLFILCSPLPSGAKILTLEAAQEQLGIK